MLLKEEIAFYKVCFDSMQMGILVCDANQNIVLCNTPLEEIFGYTNKEILEINASVFFEDSNIFSQFISLPEGDDHHQPIEIYGVKKDGSKVFLEVTFGNVWYQNTLYYKAIISDISERKEKEQQITGQNSILKKEIDDRSKELHDVIEQLKVSLLKEKEINHLKTKFITMASHEFKTPLSALLTSTELIIKYSDLNLYKNRDEHVAKVKSVIDHLNKMLDGFLTLENIEAGNITPNFSNFDCNSLINEIKNHAQSFLKNKQSLQINNNISETICQDAHILNIIITNLLYNAIKYSEEDGQIVISCNQNKSNLYFSIEDQGIGIPKNEQNLIFKRFFRAKNAMYYPGTGIGLNIVKGYVNSLNGSISFESEEHKGTIFKVQLPKIDCNE